MKTRNYLSIAAALVLAACSNDNAPHADDLKDTPITVTAGVAELKTRAGYETNKEDDTQSVLPKTFYLSIDQTGTDYDYTNMLMTKADEDNTYTASETLLWKDSNRDVAINAYTTDGTTFTVQTNQSTDTNVLASDLLGAYSGYSNVEDETDKDITITDNNIGICFRHLLCKLDVTFAWNSEFSGIENKSIKRVSYSGFGTSATLDRAACTVTADDDATTGYITAYLNGTTSEAIFAPKTDNPTIAIIATIEGTDREFELEVTAPSAGWRSGNRYTMNVTIGGTTVENPVVTATGWGSSIEGKGMETE